MKKLNLILFIICTQGIQLMNAQTGKVKPKAAFLSLDVQGYSAEITSQANSTARLSIESIKIYELLDRYDIEYLAKKENLKIESCYGKICLTEIGKALNVNKMITGSLENLGDKLIISLKIIDIDNDLIEKTNVLEFLNIPKEIPLMVKVSVNDLFNIPNDENIVNKLSRKSDYEHTLNNPDILMLRADGPRMGFTYFTGDHARILKSPLDKGGYNATPLMFQFGYQFEKQYLNEGNFQALFEFIPMVTGLDQGFFIPSFTFLNGLRDNKRGWEFAFGPSISFVKKTFGYYNSNMEWVKVTNLNSSKFERDEFPEAPDILEQRLDKRGRVFMSSSFVLAAGKTFKSGRLNIPLNFYAIPNKNSLRVGVSVGFNSKQRVIYQ